jgi:hypothetical protein
MIRDIDYIKFVNELQQLQTSSNTADILECAYHYGHFGFNAYTVKYLEDAKHPSDEDISKHKAHLDSIFTPLTQNTLVKFNNFSQINRGNCNIALTEEYEIDFEFYSGDSREIGIYIQLLPLIEIVKAQTAAKKIKINCNERLRSLFEKYFPYIEIGTSKNKINYFEIIEYVYNHGGSALIRKSVLDISKKIRPDISQKYIGINWFANTIFDRYRSIPIGLLINTVGIHSKDLKIKSFQYNDPKLEIDIFNRYSKNKITSTFDNDINTSVLEILDAVKECYCFVGIQSEASVIAYSLCGIPTIVTAGSPHFYWYFLNRLNPFLHTIRMRYAGDYNYISEEINKLL